MAFGCKSLKNCSLWSNYENVKQKLIQFSERLPSTHTKPKGFCAANAPADSPSYVARREPSQSTRSEKPIKLATGMRHPMGSRRDPNMKANFDHEKIEIAKREKRAGIGACKVFYLNSSVRSRARRKAHRGENRNWICWKTERIAPFTSIFTN